MNLESKKIGIHQPNFAPWFGFFEKMIISDIFVLLDDALVSNGGSYANRVKIRDQKGEFWLTIPIKHTSAQKKYNETQIDYNQEWQKKLLNIISHSYHRTPYFSLLFPVLKQIFYTEFSSLFEFNKAIIDLIISNLELKTNIVISSNLDLNKSQKVFGVEKILTIVKNLGGTEYISGNGKGAVRYVNPEVFIREGIKLTFQEYNHPEYKQIYPDFIKNLSVLDLIFNCGPEAKHLLNQKKLCDGFVLMES